MKWLSVSLSILINELNWLVNRQDIVFEVSDDELDVAFLVVDFKALPVSDIASVGFAFGVDGMLLVDIFFLGGLVIDPGAGSDGGVTKILFTSSFSDENIHDTKSLLRVSMFFSMKLNGL
jgi:hypothetical protein